jgi:hypothetical protein
MQRYHSGKQQSMPEILLTCLTGQGPGKKQRRDMSHLPGASLIPPLVIARQITPSHLCEGGVRFG